MTLPADFIMPRKVGKNELYRIFNDPVFRADVVRRTNQQVEVSVNPASAACNQVPGTMSHVYDWYEYIPQENRTRLLATVHLFKKPDGTLGASGQPDPVLLVIDGVPLTDP